EALLALYVRKYKINARVVRVFNTYGPGMSFEDQRVIPQFMRSIATGEPIYIYGDGSQTRTHLYVDDLIRGILLVMETGRAGEAYNIGGDKPITVRRLAELMLGLTNRKNGITYKPHFIEDHNHRRPGVKKVRALGWQPRVSLKDGLKKIFMANDLKSLLRG
ncbi:MAG: NAD-dependent epimerase/dehydratase family protein, partial [Candidatus Omnitrophota bacterium]|nr:NAD-dependent epimerase/dehydratase family protein [Candidatus Omnitrophota bacterium]